MSEVGDNETDEITAHWWWRHHCGVTPDVINCHVTLSKSQQQQCHCHMSASSIVQASAVPRVAKAAHDGGKYLVAFTLTPLIFSQNMCTLFTKLLKSPSLHLILRKYHRKLLQSQLQLLAHKCTESVLRLRPQLSDPTGEMEAPFVPKSQTPLGR